MHFSRRSMPAASFSAAIIALCTVCLTSCGLNRNFMGSQDAAICLLCLDITSESNFLFDKYDIAIYLDGEQIGTVADGDTFTKAVETTAGSHVILVRDADDDSRKAAEKINLTGDMTFQCSLAHGESITFNDVKLDDGIL